MTRTAHADEMPDCVPNEMPGVDGYITAQGKTIHYVTSGKPGAPKVIFVHGAIGGWESFCKLLKDEGLKARATMISVDRAGHGQSDPNLESSLQAQAELLLPLMELDDPNQPVIVEGSSYGGAIAARMAMSADPRIHSVIFAATIADPALAQKEWYRYIEDLPWVQDFLPHDYFITNGEADAEQPELELMHPLWSQIQARVTEIQGLADTSVLPANADFIETQLAQLHPTIERVPGLDHRIVTHRPDLIRDAINVELDAISSGQY